MPDILDQIDAATDNRCMCGCGTALEPTGPSAYYVDAAHQQAWMRAQTTRPHEVRGSEGVDPDHMRWRPDLVTDADDANLLSLGSQNWYDGRHNAQVFERTDRPETWHLRLDDGHRYVGADLAEVGGRQDPITAEMEARIKDAWRRLERELANTRHLAAGDGSTTQTAERYLSWYDGAPQADGDPWADVYGSPASPAADRIASLCRDFAAGIADDARQLQPRSAPIVRQPQIASATLTVRFDDGSEQEIQLHEGAEFNVIIDHQAGEPTDMSIGLLTRRMPSRSHRVAINIVADYWHGSARPDGAYMTTRITPAPGSDTTT